MQIALAKRRHQWLPLRGCQKQRQEHERRANAANAVENTGYFALTIRQRNGLGSAGRRKARKEPQHRIGKVAGPLARNIRPPEHVVVRQLDMLDVRYAAHRIAYGLRRWPAVTGDNQQLCGDGLGKASVKGVDQSKRRDDLRILGN